MSKTQDTGRPADHNNPTYQGAVYCLLQKH